MNFVIVLLHYYDFAYFLSNFIEAMMNAHRNEIELPYGYFLVALAMHVTGPPEERYILAPNRGILAT